MNLLSVLLDRFTTALMTAINIDALLIDDYHCFDL
jgi:hypothetical protein